tara:strand:- start:749 stop:967 length:219 start_codon:yes stop_codon:yes gene_type:complete
MQYGTYLRIESLAGGVCASDRALIRAMRRKLAKKALKREFKATRRALIKDLFEYRDAALSLYGNVIKGRQPC